MGHLSDTSGISDNVSTQHNLKNAPSSHHRFGESTAIPQHVDKSVEMFDMCAYVAVFQRLNFHTSIASVEFFLPNGNHRIAG